MLLTDFVSIKTIRWIYVLPNNVKICVVKYFLLAIKHFLIFDLHFFRLYLNGQLTAALPLSFPHMAPSHSGIFSASQFHLVFVWFLHFSLSFEHLLLAAWGNWPFKWLFCRLFFWKYILFGGIYLLKLKQSCHNRGGRNIGLLYQFSW